MKTLEITGAYTNAKIYTTENKETAVDQIAVEQVQRLCDFLAAENTTIRVMPDFHVGKGSVIGLTMNILDKVMPNLVGVDIGCGVSAHKIEGFYPEFKKLDKVIREKVPSGIEIHKIPAENFTSLKMDTLRCANHVDLDRAACSLGTLGSGNHFIEIGKGENDSAWLIIHSGSRHLGLQICNYYVQAGFRTLQDRNIDVPKELAWVDGSLMEDYLHDMQLATTFAAENRRAMCKAIFNAMDWEISDEVQSTHNYIDQDKMLRKGAISANSRCIIPINMRDGVIIGVGKNNPDWNNSAPHGAGRIFSRTEAKKRFTLEEFKKSMEGIFSTCVHKRTIDEAPFAYRTMDDIKEAIHETVDVEQILKPVYNFKA